MDSTDFRLLCSALGFTAIILQGGKAPKHIAARQAGHYAKLIEEFCRLAIPEAFEGAHQAPASSEKFLVTERMASAIVSLIRSTGQCLPQDLVAKGFSYDEINRHWAMAKALAYVELNIMDS